ncbi:MAG: hypothetical protein IKQ41_12430 [Clostridia bacterium]|nr:hypothetical protein [Clostridia bacterium]
MNIQFLGTAAAEGVPAVFCRCEMCEYARKAGGREIRTRAGAIIDGRLKLDFGPDSYHHMLTHGLRFADVHSVLVTHSHSDHFSPLELEFRSPVYSDIREDEPPMTIYGNEAVGALAEPYLRAGRHRLAFRKMTPFEPVEIEGYRVTALEAVHCTGGNEKRYPVEFMGRTLYRTEDALFYLVEKGASSILYAHDTCEFSRPDMEFLAGKKLGLISLDCTGGSRHSFDYTHWAGHMSADGCLRMRDKLLRIGAADGHTVFVASHFSHNGCAPFETLRAALPGFVIACDGMQINTPCRKEGV